MKDLQDSIQKGFMRNTYMSGYINLHAVNFVISKIFGPRYKSTVFKWNILQENGCWMKQNLSWNLSQYTV